MVAIDDLQRSTYLESVLKAVSAKLQPGAPIRIVSFGLGHIGECLISRYQLGLLLCLKKYFNPETVLVHDPIFYKSECDIFKAFDIEVIEKNNEGSYVISEEFMTILFMPHCPKQLTNNFLWSNWGRNLEKCVLICNSFSSLVDNQINRILIDTVPYIHKIITYTEEIKLLNDFKYTDIFNDISIHTFPSDILNKLDTEFWIKGEKPNYEDNEEFISSHMIDKLSI